MFLEDLLVPIDKMFFSNLLAHLLALISRMASASILIPIHNMTIISPLPPWWLLILLGVALLLVLFNIIHQILQSSPGDIVCGKVRRAMRKLVAKLDVLEKTNSTLVEARANIGDESQNLAWLKAIKIQLREQQHVLKILTVLAKELAVDSWLAAQKLRQTARERPEAREAVQNVLVGYQVLVKRIFDGMSDAQLKVLAMREVLLRTALLINLFCGSQLTGQSVFKSQLGALLESHHVDISRPSAREVESPRQSWPGGSHTVQNSPETRHTRRNFRRVTISAATANEVARPASPTSPPHVSNVLTISNSEPNCTRTDKDTRTRATERYVWRKDEASQSWERYRADKIRGNARQAAKAGRSKLVATCSHATQNYLRGNCTLQESRLKLVQSELQTIRLSLWVMNWTEIGEFDATKWRDEGVALVLAVQLGSEIGIGSEKK